MKTLLTDEEQRKELISQLDEELGSRREFVLKKASELLKKNVSIYSLVSLR